MLAAGSRALPRAPIKTLSDFSDEKKAEASDAAEFFAAASGLKEDLHKPVATPSRKRNGSSEVKERVEAIEHAIGSNRKAKKPRTLSIKTKVAKDAIGPPLSYVKQIGDKHEASSIIIMGSVSKDIETPEGYKILESPAHLSS